MARNLVPAAVAMLVIAGILFAVPAAQASVLDTAGAPVPAGTGKAAAEAEAKELGVVIVWRATSGGLCGGPADVSGCYLPPSNTIVVNSSYQSTSVATMRFVVAHEAAHYRTFRMCGTLDPPISGTRYEHVTDAYAVTVLGVPAARGGYGFTPSDAAIAQQIAAGTCVAGQRTAVVTSPVSMRMLDGGDPITLAVGAVVTIVGNDTGSFSDVRDGSGRVGLVATAWLAAPSSAGPPTA
ncbi:MAG: hypothetical protein FWF28_03280 [Micrococcales bacterium]|nr:hypothetical protein [Micrococcales bacterium]